MRTSRIAGVLLVLAGLTVNKWTLETFVVADGVISTTLLLSVVAAAEFGLVVAGVWLYVAAPRLRRPSAGQLALLIVSTTLSLALAEVGLRLGGWVDEVPDSMVQIQQARSRPMFEPVNIGWRMIPNHESPMVVEEQTNIYASNAQGFRSPHDFSQAVATRVAVAGDSFAWGWGVDYEQSFGALLEARTAGVQVDNFGMPGFGIDQIWQSVRTQVLPLKPALVIVAFIDDDFSRSLYPVRVEEGFPKPVYEVAGGQLTLQTAPGAVERSLQHSALWKLIDHAFIRVRPFGQWWRLNTALFDTIGEDCARAGVPVLFVRLPQIDGSAFPSLARHFRQRSLDYIDIGESSPLQDIHYKEDRHLNARGHEYVAQVIAEWMAQHQPRLVR